MPIFSIYYVRYGSTVVVGSIVAPLLLWYCKPLRTFVQEINVQKLVANYSRFMEIPPGLQTGIPPLLHHASAMLYCPHPQAHKRPAMMCVRKMRQYREKKKKKKKHNALCRRVSPKMLNPYSRRPPVPFLTLSVPLSTILIQMPK